MNNKQQFIALFTLIRHEIARMFRIPSQVFLPAVITSTLYFLIFGHIIGQKIGSLNGTSYASFIAPGLVMMTVITNAYGNVSTSLFNARFQKSIEEILVSPMATGCILAGYIIGGVIRGTLVACLVLGVSLFFTPISWGVLPGALLVIMLVSIIFASAGFANALFAKNFDEIMLIPTFILTPLTYLGGVFYSTTMLPPFWKTLSAFNPIWYMVDAFRHTIIGHGETSFSRAMVLLMLLAIALITLDLWLLKRGTGLRD